MFWRQKKSFLSHISTKTWLIITKLNRSHLIIEPGALCLVRNCSINYNYRKMIAFNDTKTQANGFPSHFLLISSSLGERKLYEKQNMLQSFPFSSKKRSWEKRRRLSFSGCFFSTSNPYTHKFFFFQLLIHMFDWKGLLLWIVVCLFCSLKIYSIVSSGNSSSNFRWKQQTFRLSLCAVKLNLFLSSMALCKNKNMC